MNTNSNKFTNQSGASAIMFTMFFIIVISLISLGFATLARRDQRATLDKTLSAQAQLAAETGINSVSEYIRSQADPKSNSDCVPGADVTGSGYKLPKLSEGTEIKCITWQTKPYEAGFTLKPFEAYSFNQLNHSGFTGLQWKTDGAANGSYYSWPGSNTLPTIQDGYKSIIKVVTVTTSDLYTDDADNRAQVFYLVPYNSGDVNPSVVTDGQPDYGNDYVDLGNANIGDLPTEKANGLVYYVPCAGDTCSVQIAGYSYAGNGGSYGDRLFYFMPMGTQTTSITYKSLDGYNGAAKELEGIQTKIDVDVIAQDQSKRLISYIPAQPKTNTWQPFFAAVADELCKDIKVDGTNNSGLQGGVCPNN